MKSVVEKFRDEMNQGGQRTLFDRIGPAARTADAASSFAAVDKLNRTGARQHQCEQVLSAMEQTLAAGYFQRITALELAEATGLDRYLISRRLPDLVRLGKIKNETEIDGVKQRATKICSVCGEKTLAFWIERNHG